MYVLICLNATNAPLGLQLEVEILICTIWAGRAGHPLGSLAIRVVRSTVKVLLLN